MFSISPLILSTKKAIFTAIYITIFICIGFISNAQSNYQIGLQVGASNYFGDISPNEFNAYLKQSDLMLGGVGRIKLNNFINLRGGYNYGWVKGDDNFSKDEGRNNRNLAFRTTIQEIDLAVEYNFIGFQPVNYEHPISPYIFLGASYLNFSPKRKYNDEWIDLQPLGTEGQGTSSLPGVDFYDLSKIIVKFGIGVKFSLSENIMLNFDLDIRSTETDYIDDVSGEYAPEFNTLINENGPLAPVFSWPQSIVNGIEINDLNYPAGNLRGNVSQKDWYSSINVGLSYNFINKRSRSNRSLINKLSKCFKFKK